MCKRVVGPELPPVLGLPGGALGSGGGIASPCLPLPATRVTGSPWLFGGIGIRDTLRVVVINPRDMAPSRPCVT